MQQKDSKELKALKRQYAALPKQLNRRTTPDLIITAPSEHYQGHGHPTHFQICHAHPTHIEGAYKGGGGVADKGSGRARDEVHKAWREGGGRIVEKYTTKFYFHYFYFK